MLEPRSRGGRRSRQKVERAIVQALRDAGLGAERIPLSGSAEGSYTGDITEPCLGSDLCIAVKARAAVRIRPAPQVGAAA